LLFFKNKFRPLLPRIIYKKMAGPSEVGTGFFFISK